MNRLEEALAYLREQHSPSEPNYLTACDVVADNIDALPYRVFIHLPGGLNSNNDSAWDNIKAKSEECCSCGNERVFEPRDMRHEFEPSAVEPIVMSFGDTLYIRPIGAPAVAAYMKFEVIESRGLCLTYMEDPMASSIDFSNLFKTPGFRLADLVEPLSRQKNGEPAVFSRDLKHVKHIPLVGVAAVNLEVGTITLILDAAVEAFNPDEEKVHAH